MPRRYHKSYGDWISTMSFFGVSIYACLKGLEFFDQGNFIRAFFLILASILCLLGSLRYPIARFFDVYFGRNSDPGHPTMRRDDLTCNLPLDLDHPATGQTIRNIVPTKTWKPWKPVAIKNVAP